MKFIKFTLLTTLLTSSLGSFAQSSAGLIAHWNFNGNSDDVTGNGHDGTDYNTVNAAGKSGVPNTAYRFNGTSSYITTPYRSDLNMTQYSICAVIKPMGYYTGQCQANFILHRGSQYASSSYGMHYFDNAYDGNNCGNVDTAHNVFTGLTGDGYYQSIDAYYTPPIVSNTWYNVVVTFDGTNMKTYVDGVLKSNASPQWGGISGTSTDSLFIGASYNGTGGSYPYWINAYLDDLRLYNRVLADTEVVEYNTNVTIPTFNTSLCMDKTFNLPYNIEGTFKAGNIFTAELSNASGSFASPTVIGTTAATTAGVIACTIPTSLTPGSGYLVRINASNPAKISDAVGVTINSSATPAVTLAATPSTSVGGITLVGMGNTITFKATPSTPATSYIWKKNSTVITGATTDTYTAIAGINFVSNDTISVTYKTGHTCAPTDSAIAKLTMEISTGIEDINNSFNTGIYPNPNNGNFVLKGYVPVNGDVQVIIQNTIGQTVYAKQVTISDNSINEPISLSGFGAGIYQVKIGNETSSKTLRVTVQ